MRSWRFASQYLDRILRTDAGGRLGIVRDRSAQRGCLRARAGRGCCGRGLGLEARIANRPSGALGLPEMGAAIPSSVAVGIPGVGRAGFFGGLIHAPANYDGLAYRIPRVLHWLAEGRWHLIETIFPG